MTRRVCVGLGDRSYDVVVGSGAVAELASLVPSSVRRIALITQTGVPVDIGPHLPKGVSVSRHVVGNGEEHKTLATIERLCDEFADRKSVV